MHLRSFQTLLVVFALKTVQVYGQNGTEIKVSTESSSFISPIPILNPQGPTNQSIQASSQTTTILNATTTPMMEKSTSQSTTPIFKNSTTSTPKPPPVIPATPPFPKNIGNWKLNYKSKNSSCIMITGAMQLQFSTEMQAETSSQAIDVPKEATAHGSCENSTTTQSLNLEWITTDDKWRNSLTISFEKNDTEATYNIHQVQFSYWKLTNGSGINSENGHNGTVSSDGSYFSTHLNRSFLCTAKQLIIGNLQVQTADLQFEAFRPVGERKDAFNDPQLCSADTSHAITVIGIVLGSILLLIAAIGLGMFLGVRYGYFSFPCCNRASGYRRLDI